MAAAAVILDLDGTVWDSRPWFANAIARLSGGSAVQVKRELDADANIIQVMKDYGVSKSQFEWVAREDGGTMQLYEQVIPTLDRLRARGTPMGIVTNLPGWIVMPLLEATGIGNYAAGIATPRAGIPAKPKPHGLRSVLAELKLKVDVGIWFVGDGTIDAAAAEAASVRFAWASFGYGSEEPNGTDKVLMSFDELLDL